MGGKTKHAQRTKNNSRPSSSGRSAELLGSSLPGFVGFTSIENVGFVPVAPGFGQQENLPDEFDSSVDPTFQIILRKMTKKDPITKYKALQEFCEIISKSDVEMIKAILPFWPKLYSNLSTDVEHRVREGAQLAQAALVGKTGKHIAPVIKQLAPFWITTQYDTYAPAASLACNSLEKAFPPHKLKEVFTFCQNEILDYVTKNVTVHTVQTLCNTKSNTVEECEAKYQRIIISSLKGYALFLEKIDPAQLKEAVVKHETLIDNPKFWSFHKNKSALIRSAWFEALASILQNGRFLLEKHDQQVTTSVLQNIDDSEPTVLPHLWACVLLVMGSVENWHTYINFEKAFFPKFWKVLKNGGNGNANIIFPHMLPIVSKFTKEVLGDRTIKFYSELFENYKEGLQCISVQNSRSDVSNISTAYFECLQYVMIYFQKHEILSKDELNEFCFNLINLHIIDVVKWLLTSSIVNRRHIFNQISSILSYWCQQSTNHPFYDSLLKHIWPELTRVITESIESKESNFVKITEAHMELIQCLKLCGSGKVKNAKVKFNSDVDEIDSAVESKPIILGFESDLNEFVYKICYLFIGKADELNDQVFINHLETLLRDFGTEELFKKLANSEDITILYEKLSKWLSCDSLRSEKIVEIILFIYKYISDEKRNELLKNLIQHPSEDVQNWIILRLLSHPLSSEPNIASLLHESNVIKHLVRCANSVVNGDTKDNLNLLHKCFFQNDSGDILIDPSTCEKIVDVISIPLTNDSHSDVLDTCASFLAQIMPVIFSDDEKKSLQNSMFLKLFNFSVNKVISDNLSEDTLWEITTSWQDALSSQDIILNDLLLKSCTNIIDKKLSETNNISITSLENIAEIVAKLIMCSTEKLTDDSEKLKKIDEIIDLTLNRNTKKDKEETASLTKLCLFIESLNGDLCVSSLENLDCKNNLEFFDIFIQSVFKLNVITKITCNLKKDDKKNIEQDDESEADEECTEDYCDLEENLIKQWSDEVYDQIIECFYLAGLGDILILNTTNMNSYIEGLIIYLTEKISQFLKSILDENVGVLKSKIFHLANQNGLIWTKCLLSFLTIEQYSDKQNGAILLYEDAVTVVSKEDNMLSYINILQVLSTKIPLNSLPVQPNLFSDYSNLLVKMVATKCLILNHFSSDFNNVTDRKIITNCFDILNEVIEKKKINSDFLLYNCDVSKSDDEKIIFVTELANLLTQIIKYFPTELNIGHWDLIRVALSSWTLNVAKGLQGEVNSKVSIFTSSIYKLFTSVTKFVKEEHTKSSTESLSKVIEEWDELFAKDVHLILIKSFMNIVNRKDITRYEYLLDAICPNISTIDLKHVVQSNKIDSKTSFYDLVDFCLNNISHKLHSVKIVCAEILKNLSTVLIAKDTETLLKRNEREQESKEDNDVWHILHQFKKIIDEHHSKLSKYIEDFSFRINEVVEAPSVPNEEAIPYLLLCDCILDICSKSTAELRSIYATWIMDNKYHQAILMTLFRLMPSDVLKNPDAKLIIGQTMFARMEWRHISISSLSSERYACHIYAQMIRSLPAVVRKWWHDTNPRQASLVDKITTNFVSSQLCQEELRALIEKKEKHKNMQIKVHSTSREVHATYSIDEARMELIITLPINHPLGAVKVESGKQIGGRVKSRVLVMQLTIFLTHQNGTIMDGLSLWKRNLDRKFEGVEECYICYSVIHQDTCQLPRLSCKTCKKKFHGPCLYKWFSTSNKSTCPICRNIF